MNKEKLAQQSAEILENPVFQQVFSKLESQVIDEWSFATTPEKREHLHLKLKILQSVKAEMMQHIEKMAVDETRHGNKQGPFRAIWNRLINKNKEFTYE